MNYVRVFNELPQSETYWCCDLDINKLNYIKNAYPFAKVSEDYKDILNNPEIDAVCISTPASTHYKIAKECLQSGKDVLVEKPFTMSVAEGKKLIKLSEETKRIIMVGHIFRYNHAVQQLKKYISNGDIGNVYYIHASRTGLGPIRNDVNAMWDLAPHDISIILYLLDSEPSNVIARGQSFLQEGKEDVVFMTLEFPNKIIANIHVSWLDPQKVRKVTVVGSKKMAVFDDTENLERLKIFDKGATIHKPAESYGEFRLLLRDGDIHIPKVDTTEPLKKEALHFLECIKERKKPLTDGEDGLKVVKILEAAQKSLKNNGKTVDVV